MLLRRTVATTLLVGFLGVGGTATAFADTTGNHGPPNQTCQNFLMAGGKTPGHTSQSPGSPFDEPGFGAQPAGGKGGIAYSNAGAPAQYDVACFQQFQHMNR